VFQLDLASCRTQESLSSAESKAACCSALSSASGTSDPSIVLKSLAYLGSRAEGARLALVGWPQSLRVRRECVGAMRASGGPKAASAVSCHNTGGTFRLGGTFPRASRAEAPAFGCGQLGRGGKQTPRDCWGVLTRSGLDTNDEIFRLCGSSLPVWEWVFCCYLIPFGFSGLCWKCQIFQCQILPSFHQPLS